MSHNKNSHLSLQERKIIQTGIENGSTKSAISKKRIIDKEFKINAVKYRQEHSDLTWEEVAKNLGISKSSIHRWCKEFQNEEDIKSDNVFRGSGNYASNEAKELARLKKENRDLKDALEILKKAMNILNSQ